RYDLIFADFPYPLSYDLGTLFSREFYAILAHHLAPGGLALFDVPAPEEDAPSLALSVVAHTFAAAGFRSIFLFGPDETFAAVSAEERDLAFDFSELDKKAANMTWINLLARQELLEAALKTPARVNSLFFPVDFHGLDEAVQ